MGSSPEWTAPPWQGLTIQLRDNELILKSLYRPAYPRGTLRQIEEEEEDYIQSQRSLDP